MNLRQFSLISLILWASLPIVKAEKHALLVGVSAYPSDSGWSTLSSKNDIEHIMTALLDLGFEESDIEILLDEQATKNGIVSSFEALARRVSPGDLVYVHFSGHGQQVIDDNGDEIDGLDEALVPYDSPLKFLKGVNEGQFLLRDDELNLLCAAVRQILGPSGQFLLALDACHSGTGTRSRGRARGSDIIMGDLSNTVNSAAESSYNLVQNDDPSLAPLQAIFGSSPNELNFETIDDEYNPIGSLSFAISKVLSQMKENYSFQEFYERVSRKMLANVPDQNPRIEGVKERRLFASENVKLKDKYSIIEWIDSKTVKISAGTIHGIFLGSIFSLNSNNGSESLGRVVNSHLDHSILLLDNSLENFKNQDHSINLAEAALAPTTISLRNDLGELGDEGSELWKRITKLSYVQEGKNDAPFILSSCQTPRREVQLLDLDGQLIFEKSLDYGVDGVLEKLTEQLNLQMAVDFLRSFEVEDAELKLEVKIRNYSKNSSDGKSRMLESVGDHIEVGEQIKIIVKNVGVKGAYFNLFDIQPNNIINPLIPNPQSAYSSDDFFLAPGQEYITDYFIKIYPPIGKEVFKLLYSSRPLDLVDSITKPSPSRSNDDLFSSLLFQDQSRSANSKHKGSILSNSISFQIIQ